MKIASVLCALALVLGSNVFCGEPAVAPAEEFKSQKEKVSYTIGLNIGKNLKEIAESVDIGILTQAIKDELAGVKPKMSEEEMQKTMLGFQQEMQTKQAAKAKKDSEENVKKGEAYLADNAKKEGVKTTASGLQYKVLKEGEGASPKATDTVVVHYKGTLTDGKQFDSSYDRKQPAEFPVNQVIPGWTEALQLMKPGAKFQLWIPSKLGYGERGAGDRIGPNETLVFEVELIEIKKQ